jgi:hypothetical protein
VAAPSELREVWSRFDGGDPEQGLDAQPRRLPSRPSTIADPELREAWRAILGVVEALRTEIDNELRRAAAGDYNDELDGLIRAAWAAQRLARGLTREQAKAARSTLRQVLEMRLVGACTPMCCNASSVRAETIAAKYSCLQAWTRRDPEVAEELPTALIDALLLPYSRRLALATAELFARAPRASARHLSSLLQALEEHPRWQVRDALARALGRAALDERPSLRLLRALDRAATADEPQLKRTATKALAALSERANRPR